MSKIHNVKILSEYFKAVCTGRKTFEIRHNDRDYAVGDSLKLDEIREDLEPTGNSAVVEITYISDYMQRSNFVVLGIKLISISKAETNPHGWIPWYGGVCPLKDGTYVNVVFRNGTKSADNAEAWRWTHSSVGLDNILVDIVAYRISEEQHRGSWTHCLAE